MKKFLFAGLAIILLAVVAGYVASPYIAFYELQRAARAGDRDGLEAGVDFPAVREDFKAQLNGALLTKVQSDPGLRNNPFAALGLLLGPAVIDRVVDAYITPQGIALMVAKARTPKQGGAPASGDQPRVVAHYAYVSLDRFKATVSNTEDAGAPSLDFVMERRGLFTWKLIRIQLPLAALK